MVFRSISFYTIFMSNPQLHSQKGTVKLQQPMAFHWDIYFKFIITSGYRFFKKKIKL